MCVQEKQEAQEAASVQLRKEKAGHEEQYRELLGQLEQLRAERREGDREVGRLRASLKGSESEVVRLSESVARLTQQLERDRESHAISAKSLQTIAEEGRSKVSGHHWQPCGVVDSEGATGGSAGRGSAELQR